VIFLEQCNNIENDEIDIVVIDENDIDDDEMVLAVIKVEADVNE
jgi:hypothetical protein